VTGDGVAGAFAEILRGRELQQNGQAVRDAAIMAMQRDGLRPRAIADALHVQAVAAGLTAEQITHLGISVHNVRQVIRTHRWGHPTPV